MGSSQSKDEKQKQAQKQAVVTSEKIVRQTPQQTVQTRDDHGHGAFAQIRPIPAKQQAAVQPQERPAFPVETLDTHGLKESLPVPTVHKIGPDGIPPENIEKPSNPLPSQQTVHEHSVGSSQPQPATLQEAFVDVQKLPTAASHHVSSDAPLSSEQPAIHKQPENTDFPVDTIEVPFNQAVKPRIDRTVRSGSESKDSVPPAVGKQSEKEKEASDQPNYGPIDESKPHPEEKICGIRDNCIPPNLLSKEDREYLEKAHHEQAVAGSHESHPVDGHQDAPKEHHDHHHKLHGHVHVISLDKPDEVKEADIKDLKLFEDHKAKDHQDQAQIDSQETEKHSEAISQPQVNYGPHDSSKPQLTEKLCGPVDVQPNMFSTKDDLKYLEEHKDVQVNATLEAPIVHQQDPVADIKPLIVENDQPHLTSEQQHEQQKHPSQSGQVQEPANITEIKHEDEEPKIPKLEVSQEKDHQNEDLPKPNILESEPKQHEEPPTHPQPTVHVQGQTITQAQAQAQAQAQTQAEASANPPAQENQASSQPDDEPSATNDN